MYKQEELIENISKKLSLLKYHIGNLNLINLRNANIISENFFADFLNTLYGYNLKNINHFTPNHDTIDLVDEGKKYCIQVTSDNTAEKIKSTIKQFIDKNYYLKYERLDFLILKDKTNHTKPFDTKKLFSFSCDKNILDINFLIKEISKQDVSTLTAILNFLETNLNDITSAKGIKFKIETEDIKNILLVFKKYKSEILEEISSREDYKFKPDLPIKNKLNNVSEDYFEYGIKADYKDFKIIDEFLENPRNEEFVDIYYDIAKDVKNKLIAKSSEFKNFKDSIIFVYDYIIENEKDLRPKHLVYILLHYMYCQCDIGKTPIAKTT